MAITLLSDLLPYANQFREGYIDSMVEASRLFNEGSNGAIRFTDSDAKGTLTKTAYFKDFGTVSRRDITSTSDQTPEKIERDEHTMFRTYFKLNAIEWQDEAFWTSDRMQQDAIMYMIGGQLAKKKMQESIKQAINIASTAIVSGDGASHKTVLDLTSPKQNFLQPQVNLARMKFGAEYGRLKIMVMHSSVFFALIQNQTLNYMYDLGGGVTLYGGIPATMGMPFIVSDQPSLIIESGDDIFYKTLLLTDSAITLADAGPIRANLQTIGGKENISHLYQAEWSMWNNVKGYQLKAAANPQSNPSDSTLTTSSNWEQWVADTKNTAGVLVKSIADPASIQQVINVRYVSDDAGSGSGSGS